MKLKQEPRELGEWYESEPDGLYYIVVGSVILGIIILIAEWSGLVDIIINSFN